MTLSRDQILRADDLKTETVPVPEWGGEVLMRTMTGSERDTFEGRFLSGNRNVSDARAWIAATLIVDDQGKPVFSPGDVAELGRKSASALQRVFEVGMRLSGLSGDEVEDMEKNSGPAPADTTSA